MRNISLRKLCLIVVMLLSVFTVTACASSTVNQEVNYKLFPTENYWTFLKLDTRNGKITQVHFGVDKDSPKIEIDLNTTSLVDTYQEQCGRFTLYPTKNMYNFLLVDQIDGRIWQIQWSLESEYYRGVIAEIKK